MSMVPLLIARSTRQMSLVREAIPRLSTRLQIRDIDDSMSVSGDLVFPTLGVACLIYTGDVDALISRSDSILKRRRILILAPQDDVWEVQFR
jgi:hypothetical protein